MSALPQLLGTVLSKGHLRAAEYVSCQPETAQHHRTMDMNFRVSEDGDRRPGVPIAKAHTSESVLYGQVAGSDIQCHRHRQEICAGLEFVMSHDAELLKRLENA